MQKPLTNKLVRPLTGLAASVAMLVSLVLGSCNLAIDDIQAPSWDPEVLAPIARTTVDLASLKDFTEISIRADFTAAELGLPIGETNGSTFSFDLGPYDYTTLEGLVDMKSRETTLAFDLFNSLPCTMAAGSIIVVRSAETGDIIMSYPIAEDLPPYGTIGDSTVFQNITFAGRLEVFVEDVVATAEPNSTISSGDGIRFDLRINFTDIEEARLEPGHVTAFSDTTDFEFEIQDIEQLDGEGELRLLIANGFPMGGNVDVFFLAEDGVTVLERLSEEPQHLPVPEIGSDGRVIGEVGTEISFDVSSEKLDNIEAASFFAFEADFFTPTEYGILTTDLEDRLEVKLIADLQLHIQP